MCFSTRVIALRTVALYGGPEGRAMRCALCASCYAALHDMRYGR